MRDCEEIICIDDKIGQDIRDFSYLKELSILFEQDIFTLEVRSVSTSIMNITYIFDR